MTYDEWRLESPEDEEARLNRLSRFWRDRMGWRAYRDAERCWNCCREWEPAKDNPFNCAYCDAWADDEPAERDPDNARDERMDREMDR